MAHPNEQFNGYSQDINRLVQKALATSYLSANQTKSRLKSNNYSQASENQSTESFSNSGLGSLYNLNSSQEQSSLPKYSDVAGNYNYSRIYSLAAPIEKHRPNSQDSLQDSSKLRALPKPLNRNSEKKSNHVNVGVDNSDYSQVKKKALNSGVQSNGKPAQLVKSYRKELETGASYHRSRSKRETLMIAGLVMAVIIILVLALFIILLALGVIGAGDSTTAPSGLSSTTASVSSNTISPLTRTVITASPGTAQSRPTSTEKIVPIIWEESTATPTPSPAASPLTSASSGTIKAGSTTTEKIKIIFS